MSTATPRTDRLEPPVRPERPERPSIARPANFKLLDQTHQQTMHMLEQLTEMLEQMESGDRQDQASRLAAEVHSFFETQVRQHHQEEETRVFPALLKSDDAELVHHVKRLQQDHGWLEEDWRLLGPQIEAIARGYNWYDLPMLRQGLPVFVALNQEHVLLEETVVYPAARQLLQQRANHPLDDNQPAA